MKYIKKVILKNFQSHKHTVIEFDKRLNVIVGPSDSGKTAILRGIKWALYNDPLGDYFIKEGESECSVKIVFSHNVKIKRYRSKSKNIYYLYDEHDNESKFEGFGVSVPEEIIEASGIKKILLDNNIFTTINISDQLEGAFLLSERASVRSSSIGYLVGVDIIDDALKETLKESRNLSNSKKTIDENIIKLEKDLSSYNYLDELNIKVKKLENILAEITKKESILTQCKKILTAYSKITLEKTNLSDYIKKLKNINELEIIVSKIELIYVKYKQMNKLMVLLKNLKLNKEKNTKIVTSLKYINDVKYNIDEISMLYVKSEKLIKSNIKLKSNYKEIKYYKEITNKLIHLDLLQKKIVEINKNTTKLKNLSLLKNRKSRVRKSLTVGHIYVNKLKEVDNISEKHFKIKENLIFFNRILKLSSNLKANSKMILENKKKLENYEKRFNIISDEYKNILLEAGNCPLCFSKIDNEKANYIVNQYK